MPYSLREVFAQAKGDGYSVNVDSLEVEARLLYGIKIIQDDEVTILDTQRGGDYYREVTLPDYEDFKEFGWRHGVYLLAIANAEARVERFEGTVAKETYREPRRVRYLMICKAQLEKAIAYRVMLNKKFSNLKSNSYDTSKSFHWQHAPSMSTTTRA